MSIRHDRELKPSGTFLGGLLRGVGVVLILSSIALIALGFKMGMEISGQRPDDHAAIGGPVVDSFLYGVPLGIAALVLFALGRIVDRR